MNSNLRKLLILILVTTVTRAFGGVIVIDGNYQGKTHLPDPEWVFVFRRYLLTGR
jgi:hypothetical protein